MAKLISRYAVPALALAWVALTVFSVLHFEWLRGMFLLGFRVAIAGAVFSGACGSCLVAARAVFASTGRRRGDDA